MLRIGLQLIEGFFIFCGVSLKVVGGHALHLRRVDEFGVIGAGVNAGHVVRLAAGEEASWMAGSDFISAFEIVSLSLIWTSGEKATFFLS